MLSIHWLLRMMYPLRTFICMEPWDIHTLFTMQSSRNKKTKIYNRIQAKD